MDRRVVIKIYFLLQNVKEMKPTDVERGEMSECYIDFVKEIDQMKKRLLLSRHARSVPGVNSTDERDKIVIKKFDELRKAITTGH